MSNLPIAEAHSDLLTAAPTTPTPTYRPAPAPIQRSIRFSAYLREARGRADEVLRQHSREEGPTGTTCLACFVAYPCAAVRAAEDVISISERLSPGRLGTSKALLDLMSELVDSADPPALRKSYGREAAELKSH